MYKSWCPNIEEGAEEQISHLANLPFKNLGIAIMPDCHQGYGMPIGAVLGIENVVIPNAVGVDIGCGMFAVNTGLDSLDVNEVVQHIRATVPLGFKHQIRTQECNLNPNDTKICREEYDSSLYQLGTLGGGNHFIEIQKDEEGVYWIMIHSGSRNLGYKVAKYYNEKAKKLNEKYYSKVPKEWDLAFLPLEDAQDYLREMQYCVEFAKLNRALIMKRALETLYLTDVFSLDIAHNFVALERHYGKNVMVHRKGATRVFKGELGVIPGSQGTNSYIVEGLGNRDSYMSCSHGAGRKMGRKQAQRELDLQSEISILDELGIMHNIRGVKDLDEAPGAYKNIDEVMRNQEDLVKIVTKLKPVAVIKG